MLIKLWMLALAEVVVLMIVLCKVQVCNTQSHHIDHICSERIPLLTLQSQIRQFLCTHDKSEGRKVLPLFVHPSVHHTLWYDVSLSLTAIKNIHQKLWEELFKQLLPQFLELFKQLLPQFLMDFFSNLVYLLWT